MKVAWSRERKYIEGKLAIFIWTSFPCESSVSTILVRFKLEKRKYASLI
jgi:hypothetical protein